ncbi:hypothetical protein H4V95_001255 [Arthrobacter sp. CAN_C5]|nr:hypothetical protein [Arthrobacter sp. CAN_C5]
MSCQATCWAKTILRLAELTVDESADVAARHDQQPGVPFKEATSWSFRAQ